MLRRKVQASLPSTRPTPSIYCGVYLHPPLQGVQPPPEVLCFSGGRREGSPGLKIRTLP